LLAIGPNSYLKLSDQPIDRSIIANSQNMQGYTGYQPGISDADMLDQIPFWYSIDTRDIMDGHPGLNSIHITLNDL
jgi:hypothetical protein